MLFHWIDQYHFLFAKSIQQVSKSRLEQGSISNNVEDFQYSDQILNASGWAFDNQTENCENDSIFIALIKNYAIYLLEANIVERKDVTAYFNKENLDNSGFNKTSHLGALDKGEYDVLIIIKKPDGVLLRDSTHTKRRIQIE